MPSKCETGIWAVEQHPVYTNYVVYIGETTDSCHKNPTDTMCVNNQCWPNYTPYLRFFKSQDGPLTKSSWDQGPPRNMFDTGRIKVYDNIRNRDGVLMEWVQNF